MTKTNCAETTDAARRQATRAWLAGLLAQRELGLLGRWLARAERRRAQWEAFRSRLPRRTRRALRARLARGVAPGLLAAALLLGQGRASAGRAPAAIIPVVGSEVAILDNGLCSLREAIINANEDTAIHDDCPAGSGEDTIRLEPSRAFQLSDAFAGQSGLPPITGAITLEGNGSTISRVVLDPVFRLITIEDGGNLVLQETTISGGVAAFGGGIWNAGSLTLEGSAVRGNTAAGRVIGGAPSGGGIFNRGSLSLNQSAVSDNRARIGGGIFSESAVSLRYSTVAGNEAQTGGGLALRGAAELASHHGVITGNTAAGHGGGIYSYDVKLQLVNSTLSGNVAGDDGGGLFAGGAEVSDRYIQVDVQSTAVEGNYAYDSGGGLYLARTEQLNLHGGRIAGNTAYTGEGGGVALSGSAVSIGSATLTGNTAGSWGGGVALRASTGGISYSTLNGNRARDGGGAAIYESAVLFAHSTVSGNVAVGSGGGIYNGVAGTTMLYLSTVTGNSAAGAGGIMNYADRDRGYSYLELHGSLVAGNVAPSGREIVNEEIGRSGRSHGAIVRADDYNLFGFGGDAGVLGFSPGPSDFTPDAALSAIVAADLADNGWPHFTSTHALPPGSPAIDAGPSEVCHILSDPARDQRGLPRFVDGDGRPSDLECDVGAYERQPPTRFTTYLSVVARP